MHVCMYAYIYVHVCVSMCVCKQLVSTRLWVVSNLAKFRVCLRSSAC